MFTKLKKKPALILNLIIVILEVIGFVIAISNNGILILGLYTQESNFVLLLASLVYLIAGLRQENIEEKASYPVAVFKFIATCLTSVTFCVVLFCFVPMCIPFMGLGGGLYAMMVQGANLCHHCLCPILTLVSYLGLERDMVPGKKECFYAMLPTLAYAIVSTSLNVAKVVRGPYPFLYVYEQPVWASVLWFIAIPGCGWLFAKLVAKLKKKLFRTL